MPFFESAQLKHVTRSDCFVTVPQKWKSIQHQALILTSIDSGKSIPVTVTGLNKFSDKIEISGVFAARNYLSDGTYVTVEAVDAADPCTEMFVDMVSAQDSDVLCNHRDAFEWLMTQVTVVSDQMIIPVHSATGVVIAISVSKTIPPGKCVRLQEHTKLNFSSPDSTNKSASLSTSVFSFLSSWTGSQQPKRQPEEPLAEEIVPVFPATQAPLNLRVVASSKSCPEISSGIQFQNTVLIHKMGKIASDHADYAIACLSHLLSPNDRQLLAVKSKDTSDTIVRHVIHQFSKLVLIRASPHCPPECAMLPDSLIRQTGIRNGERVTLSHPNDVFNELAPGGTTDTVRVTYLNEVRVRPLTNSRPSPDPVLSELLTLTQSISLFFTNNSLLSLSTGDYTAQLSQPCAFVSAAHLTGIIVEEMVAESLRSVSGNALPLKTIREAGFVKEAVKHNDAIDESVFSKARLQLSLLLSSCLGLDGERSHGCKSELSFCSILVSGPKGCGKNTLISSVLSKITPAAKVARIDCKNLHGKRLDSVYKYVVKEISEAVYREPAVLIFHDLDFFIPALTRPEEENSVEAVHILRCSLILISVMKRLQMVARDTGVRISIIATARSEDMLCPALFDKLAFNHFIKIPAPSQSERASLIRCFTRRFSGQQDHPEMSEGLAKLLSKRSEGFYPSDLCLFVEQCAHLKISLNESNGTRVRDEDFVKLLSSFQPISQRGMSLTCKSTKRLRDVGGLQSVKKIMQETLFLPLKYPALFRKCPLRPHSCLLLYGVPGTGKTLLAEAIANECGVNFLSVEGPELLSKYIGASEQAVRDLFVRAKAVKPCIIFFDEFDSIAPRRGQDSTGVTDRVVNQLLTQMDGVEELDRGIFILAATSRPDLVDPALLRPGRFDKRLKCSLPDAQERRQILDIICRNLSLHPDVDLDLIADRTEFYSGADLQAVFFTAQVAAAHKHLNESLSLDDLLSHHTEQNFAVNCSANETSGKNKLDDDAIESLLTAADMPDFKSDTRITMSQILEAITTVPSSVTEKERRKYDFM